MEQHFNTVRYDYLITLDEDGKISGFTILAVCRKTGRCSSINNLNQMLSELGVNPDNPKFFDSSWCLPVGEAARLYKKTIALFSTPSFPDFIENYLDEDRACGEWENTIQAIQ